MGNTDTSLVDELVRAHMEEDARHCKGDLYRLLDIEEMGSYFSTRDFTVNEVAVIGDTVFATPRAISSLTNHTIEPTEYELNRWKYEHLEANGIRSELVVKALRLHVENQLIYGRGELKGIAGWQWRIDELNLFYLAVNIERATQRGDVIAQKFYEGLVEKGTFRNPTELPPIPDRNILANYVDPADMTPDIKYIRDLLERGSHEVAIIQLEEAIRNLERGEMLPKIRSLRELALYVNSKLYRPFDFTDPRLNPKIKSPLRVRDYPDEEEFYEHCLDLAEDYYGSKRRMEETVKPKKP